MIGLLAFSLATPAAQAAIEFEHPGFSEEVVAADLPFATAVAFTADGRIFIALKSGVVRVWRDGTLLPTPFIDISEQVNDVFERGLLGLALHPDFPAQPFVYLLFSRDPPGVVADGAGGRVARLIRVEADPLADHDVARAGMDQARNPGCLADPPEGGCPGHVVLLGRNSLRPLIGDESNGRDTSRASCMEGGSMGTVPIVLPADDPVLPYPEGTSRPSEDCSPIDERTHTIGTVAFGRDGALFVGAGDGANFNVVDHRALRSLMLDSLAGKILRIDPATGDGLPDNPYFDSACPSCNRSKVWARGLRNPFRFAIDPLTGEPVIGDVGWNTWEEVNRGRGANFGWPCYEGGPLAGLEGGVTASLVQGDYAAHETTGTACAQLYAAGVDSVRASIFAYSHAGDGFGGAGAAAVNAGAFYAGDSYPAEFANALFLLDYSRRWIRTLAFDEAGTATVGNFGRESEAGMVQIVNGPDSNLYVVVFAGTSSEVRRIRYTPIGCGPGGTDPDEDGDGVGDCLDRCAAGSTITAARLALHGHGEAGADTWLTFRGAMNPGTGALDPPTSGIRWRLLDALGGVVADVVVPPGAGWRAVREGWVWRGEHSVLGRARLAVQRRPADPERWWVRIAARRATLGIDAGNLPASVLINLGPSAPAVCAETGLAGPAPFAQCRAAGPAQRVICR